jgi:hypothetical protein
MPGGIAAQGPEHETMYRQMLVRGLTPEQAQALLSSPRVAKLAAERESWRALANAGDVSPEVLARASQLIAQGERLIYDEASKDLMVVIDCPTSGAFSDTPCGAVSIKEFAAFTRDQVMDFIDNSLSTLASSTVGAVSEGLKAAIDCAMAWSAQSGDTTVFDTIAAAPGLSSADRSWVAVMKEMGALVSSGGNAKAIRTLNEAGINWGSMLWEVAELKANGQTEEAWSRLKELAKLAEGLGSQPGMVIESGALWGSLKTLSGKLQLANSADGKYDYDLDPLMQAKKELREASEDQQVRARRALNAYRNYLAGDTEAWENLSPEDQAAADELYGSVIDPLAALGGPLLMGGTRSPPKGKAQKPAGGGDDEAGDGENPAGVSGVDKGAGNSPDSPTQIYRGAPEGESPTFVPKPTDFKIDKETGKGFARSFCF